MAARRDPSSVIRGFKGVNRLDPFSIAPNFATSMKNLTSTKLPNLSTRQGYTVLGTAIGAKVLGIGVWKNTELHAVFSDGTWRKWTGSAWSSALASGLNGSARWTFTNFKGNLSTISLIAANGVDPVKVYDGSSVSNLATAPSGLNFIVQFADRLWGVVGNELKYSAYRMANDFITVNGDDADSGFIVIETPTGENISGLTAGLTKLTITKPNSIHELFGYSVSDFSVKPVTLDTGQINNQSACVINGIMYVLHDTGIFTYTGGSLPSKQFSQPVQDYIDRINPAARATCSMGSDGRKLYVSIPITSTTSPDTILEYDPQYETWHVWDSISALQFGKMGSNWYIGDASGRVLQMGGTSDAGNAISWEWVSIPFSAQSLAQMVRWTHLWVVKKLSTGSTMNIYISKSYTGDSDWQLIKTVTGSSNLEMEALYPTGAQAAVTPWLRVKLSGVGTCEINAISFVEDINPIK
ncbi:hypothetical protein AB4Z22_00135 [Paenibacillus sp. TAF58]